MIFDIYELIGIALYFWIAGIHAEFMHNHTCNLPMSIVASLFWPVTGIFKPKNLKETPKYYRQFQDKDS